LAKALRNYPQTASVRQGTHQGAVKRLQDEIVDLRGVLLEEDSVATETRSVAAESGAGSLEATAKVSVGKSEVGGKAVTSSKRSNEEERSERFTRTKLDLLHRRIIEYQKIFRDLSDLSGGDSYLVLDDLYHIRRSDQARVID
jgi:hypothetical protein